MITDVLNTIEAARYVRLAKPTLERFRLTGEGPRFGVEQHRRHIDGTHDPDMASPPCRRVL